MILPASDTKSLSTVWYELNSSTTVQLKQSNSGATDGSSTNGTTLWLSGQALSCYLLELYGKSKGSNAGKKVIDLGAGCGLVSLTLSLLNFDVIATDLLPVINTVLAPNVQQNHISLHLGNPSPPRLQVQELDWTVPASQWSWEAQGSISNPQYGAHTAVHSHILPPFDLIVTTDTLYSTSLVAPLLQTLVSISELSPTTPLVIIALERRDPALIKFALESAYNLGFECKQVAKGRLEKALDKGGVSGGKEEWDGVELWRLKLKNRS